jgi:hemerythrin superfamily protein
MATEAKSSTDAIEFLTAQHREVDQWWSQLRDARPAGVGGQDVAQRIVTLLSQHDALETQILYPELRKLGDQGRQLADHGLEEHQRIRELLKEVDGRDPRDDATFTTLASCVSTVMDHVAEEEGLIFPLLRQHLDDEQLRSMGDHMRRMMSMAPTHPHPSTPNNKLGATIAGAVAGAADKVRDAVTGRPEGS